MRGTSGAMLVVVLACSWLRAASVEPSNAFGRPVILASRTLVVSPTRHATVAGRRAVSKVTAVPLLVHFNVKVEDSTRRQLASIGAVLRVLHYVPHDSWLVLARVDAIEALQGLPAVTYVHVLDAYDKLSPKLVRLCAQEGHVHRCVGQLFEASVLHFQERCVQ